MEPLTEDQKATVEANVGLVYAIALPRRRRRLSKDDRVQFGMLGLMKAVTKYEPWRGVKLSTYARYWIEAYIDRAETEDTTIRTPGWTTWRCPDRPRARAYSEMARAARSMDSLDRCEGDSTVAHDDPSARLEAEEEAEKLGERLGRLTRKQREILIGRYWDGETLKQIGRRFGVSGEAIAQWERRAIDRLRETMTREGD